MERTEEIMRGCFLSVNNSRTKEGIRNDGQILYQFC
uniref:Transposase IS4 family n=1 Tax=Escherichia albertii TaxID=208962 RepID=A0A288W5N0_ESCAL|nr:transposase IS4 family [Escherichia albertii]ARO72676.1 transposase IS4 family [Escherichia albertii]ARO72906.1 transposase IS4 family [Escherichia albertii]ARO73178.1 transposase IS4 family [Escherichia albertii]ARO73197.1 transposase IS4 family [Escherichia albertii]